MKLIKLTTGVIKGKKYVITLNKGFYSVLRLLTRLRNLLSNRFIQNLFFYVIKNPDVII